MSNLTITLAAGPTPPAARHTVILPIAFTPPADPVAEFVRLLTTDSRQERPTLTHCPKLLVAATWRAFGLAHGDPFSHVDRDGDGPNVYARRAGCVLPSGYSERGNEIESLAAGTSAAAVIFGALAGSAKHSDHLFGRGDFFRSQCCYGVAMCENAESQYGWYWCVLISVCK